jgi:hypothetical protein
LLGAIPGFALADVGLGAAAGLASDGEPATMSAMAGEVLADAVAGEDYQPREVSTLGQVGGTIGALAGLCGGGPMGMISGARMGTDGGDLFSSIFD